MTTAAPPPALTATEKQNLKYGPYRLMHMDYFRQIGKPDAIFKCLTIGTRNPNYPNQPVGKLGFFENDLKEDMYFELMTFKGDLIPADDRQLYILPFDPHFTSDTAKYQFSERDNNATKVPMYYVGVEHCFKVNKATGSRQTPPAIQIIQSAFVEPDEFSIQEELADMAFDKMTARDHICVALKIPHSNHGWINDLIEKSL